MHSESIRGALVSLALAAGILALASPPAIGATRQIPSSGTTTMQATAPGADGLQNPEVPPGMESDEGTDVGGNAGSFNRSRPGRKLGMLPHKNLDTPVVASSAVAGSNPEVALGFRGLNHRDQRLADGGNQFSLEPPDQGLCVGNGFVVEAINSVIRVWSTGGVALTGVVALNPFFGYASAINRATGAFGPDVIDAICHYDPDNNRFVVAQTTLYHVGTTSAFNGKNSIDVAVSNTGDPTGAWTIYHIPAQNDGTDGTPDHHCLDDDGVSHGPCFQDYPHIGGDRNGIYITTNEYSLFGPGFNGAQIFAFSKAQLAARPAVINVTLVENLVVDGAARIHRVARHLAGRPVLQRAKRNGVFAQHDLRRVSGGLLHRQANRPVGRDEYGVAGLRNPGARSDEPHDHQPDVRRSAQGEPEGGQHTAGRLHQ